LLSFLRIYNNIYNIGGFSEGDYSSDVEYALRINHAGRSIVEGGGCVGSIPLSLWPTILVRAHEKSEHSICYDITPKNATGLYYLLRNGPALAGRPSFGGNGELLSSSDGNDDDENAKGSAPKKHNVLESKGVLESDNDHDDDNTKTTRIEWSKGACVSETNYYCVEFPTSSEK